MSEDSLYFSDFLLESVLFHIGVSEGCANAVFGDFHGLDAQLPKDVGHGRIGEPIALEFDDYERLQLHLSARMDIAPMKRKINGQPFVFLLTDERDTAEDRSQLRQQLLAAVSASLFHKRAHFIGGRSKYRLIDYLYALFLRSTAVVLVFDFKKREIAAFGEVRLTAYIPANAHFLPHQTPVVVLYIHRERRRVVIQCVISRNAFAPNLLHEILIGSQQQHLTNMRHRGHVFRVESVHQFHGLHLAQADGAHAAQYVGQRSQSSENVYSNTCTEYNLPLGR